MLHIVSVEDDPDDVELIDIALKNAGVSAALTQVQDEAGLRRELATEPQMLLCDYTMPTLSAERVLTVVRGAANPPPLIIVTRAIGEDAIVKLFRAGARDYVTKDKLALLPSIIHRVLREEELESERRRTQHALVEAHARLRRLSSHLVDAQERERTAIARDLHDSLGQLLTSIVIHLNVARGASDEESTEAALDRVADLAKQATREVKSISFGLRPAQLELLGFEAAVRATLERRLDGSGIGFLLRRRGFDPERLLPCHAVVLRVLEEALTNVVRHAKASSVLVRLRFIDAEHFVLTVADDGRGFDPAAVLQGGLGEHNLGLHGMLERLELIGGRALLRTRPGRGTIVRMSV